MRGLETVVEGMAWSLCGQICFHKEVFPAIRIRTPRNRISRGALILAFVPQTRTLCDGLHHRSQAPRISQAVRPWMASAHPPVAIPSAHFSPFDVAT